jgi:uncharacterized membrane protein YozB (DUF420 family)
VNASLNALATVLLLAGLWQIKRQRETGHKWTMLACFTVSVVFLACYLTYHILKHYATGAAHNTFPLYPGPAVRTVYFAILISHIALAATVPFLAIASIVFGLKDWRRAHRAISKFTFPIWLYVSVTGVVVYLMLYQFFPPPAELPIP